MKVAVVGCSHGELDRIYKQIDSLAEKPELLIIAGDFQSVRNEYDLKCVSMPAKYRRLGDFHKYHTGEKVAPIMTFFIGGNHEASNYLQELPFGGFVAPSIYYLGRSSVVKYKGLTIGGISGIYNEYSFSKPAHEKAPYDRSTVRTVYHVRKLEYLKWLLYGKASGSRLDIFVSHDWPQGIEEKGDLEALLRLKPFFKSDIQQKKLGSPVNRNILQVLIPRYWLSAHMHVRFEAVYSQESHAVNEDELDVEFSDDSDSDGKDEAQTTHFLALDKCLPKRKYLEILEIAGGNAADDNIYYDETFIKVNQVVEKYKTSSEFRALDKRILLDYPNVEIELVLNTLYQELTKDPIPDLIVPREFSRDYTINPQTARYCGKFKLPKSLP